MGIRHRLWPAGLLVSLSLMGCATGSETGNENIFREIFNTGLAAIQQRRQGPPPPPTREQVEAIPQSVIEVTIESRDQTGYAARNFERRDDRPGEIVVWRTADNITLSFRNGMLIGTRGLGTDLVSAAVPAVGDAPGPRLTGIRTYDLDGPDMAETRITIICRLSELDPVQIDILGLRHDTRHLRETCRGTYGEVINDYWVDSQRRIVWQSRQWAGPGLGYLRIRQLSEK